MSIASLRSLYARRQTLYEHQAWARTYLDLQDLDAAGVDQLRKVLAISALEAAHLVGGAGADSLVQNWYLGGQYQVEQFRYADGTTITNSQVAGLLSAMASFGAEAAAETAPKLRNMQWKHPEYAVASV